MSIVELGEIASWGSGGTPSRSVREYFGHGLPWLSIADLNDGLVQDAKESLTPLGIEHSSAKPVPPGALLVAMYGSIGKLGIAARELCTSQAIAFAIPDTRRVDTRYLFHFLLSERPRLQSRGRGGTQSNIGQGDLKAWQMPLPPLPEQRRIAAILDKADALRAKRRAAIAKLDDLTRSMFWDMFGGKLDAPAVGTHADRTNVPNGCTWVLLTDVARLATGHTPDRERVDYWNGEIPWISLTDIRSLDGAVATSTLQNVTKLGIENSSAVVLPKGTVCLSRTASIGFVTVMGREMATSQDFMNWVCGPSIDPTYLMWALISSRSGLLALAPGSTHHTIYMRVVEQFRILLPSIGVQRAFANRIASANALKKVWSLSLMKLDRLFASLQQRAFRGEL